MKQQSIVCNRKECAFSQCFLIGTRFGGRVCILVKDAFLKNDLCSFLKERTDKVFLDDGREERYGFFIWSDRPSISGWSVTIVLYRHRDLADGLIKHIGDDDRRAYLVDIDENEGYDPWGDVPSGDNVPRIPLEGTLYDQEIRDRFFDAFDLAEKELDIISPWVNSNVVDEDLLAKIEGALLRGATIKILYGIGKDEDIRAMRSEETVAAMKQRFSRFGEQLRFVRDDIHVKLLLCDDKFALFGSYNFLSFSGDYTGKDTRSEAVECTNDFKKILAYRKKYFSW